LLTPIKFPGFWTAADVAEPVIGRAFARPVAPRNDDENEYAFAISPRSCAPTSCFSSHGAASNNAALWSRSEVWKHVRTTGDA
jgi:hypothetical protein